MSDPSPVTTTVEIDWKLIGSAVGVFIATMVTTVWGWMQGRKKAKEPASEVPFQVAGAVLQDNTSLRENTQAVKDLRDQILFLRDAVEKRTKSEDELNDTIEDLIKRLDGVK